MAEPRTLLLLRHGRTAWNAELRAQGHADVSLDDLGRLQAAAVAPALAARSPRLLWSSDLARARETAEHVAAATGLDVHVDARLREFDLGERTGLTMAEYAEGFPDEHRAFRAGRYEVVPGGESTDQVVTRVTAAIHDALSALGPGECGVVVGHGAALKVSLLALLGWSQDGAAGLQALDNAAWAEVAENGLEGRLRLLAWNRTAAGTPDFASREGVG